MKDVQLSAEECHQHELMESHRKQADKHLTEMIEARDKLVVSLYKRFLGLGAREVIRSVLGTSRYFVQCELERLRAQEKI